MSYDLNSQIVTLLKTHPEGGEKFFNALDFMIRNDRNILEQYIQFISELRSCVDRSMGAICTGAFGRALLTNYYSTLGKLFNNDIIVTNGGIRSGESVEWYREYNGCKSQSYVVLDDSIYSGTTYRNIVRKSPHTTKIWGIWVIYDGSKTLNKEIDIRALFRYYA